MSTTVKMETVEREASWLYAAWHAALLKHRRHEAERTARAEQEAYDELVDYVEAHDLNHSNYDPRNTNG